MDGDLRNAVTRIEGMLRHQTKLLELIMSGEDDLKAAIAANSTAITNATSELNSLAAQIVSAAKGDSARTSRRWRSSFRRRPRS